ncbi:recombinase family protein [Anaerobacillus isosaccharinicus]|uniref:Recombinase family protein n=1 Tax=Anaerobacillus isosaccharinicus TaxID=1532552 RepID=A0A1S2MDV2_9BACI|nr:recombinase family protein [Anaerobacillus isosaccharinicus]MBA5585165.1 recombinase family protein [Anaerobacillus isosaccharinicus]QOY36498.1 recombinase family protein [Anaerobacillus isosaccharinicus]
MADELNNIRMIALYCRVSTDEQAREGISLHEQQERLKAYCRAMGWHTEVTIYVDDGYSAKNIERPKLNELIRAVKNGEVSQVMVTKLDRISRKLLDLLNLIDLFQEHNVSFISISESFDTNTPSGRLTLQVLGAVAEFERERIRERVFENMYHAATTGKWLTQSPYGYNLVDKELVFDEKEAEVVKRVFNLYLEKGLGYYAIAKQLNEEGIPSKYKKDWSIRAVKLMLTNPVYKGTFVWNRKDSSKKKRTDKKNDEWIVIDDCLPVIIDKEEWEDAQKRVNAKQIAPRAKTSPHLLGGILKCGKCGASMSIGWSGSKNNRYRVYRCSANKNKGTCTSKQYRANEVEDWFKQGLVQLFEFSTNQTKTTLVEQVLQSQKKDAEQAVQNAKARYKRKVEAYTAGLIELEDLNEEKVKMEKIINNAKRDDDKKEINIERLEKQLQKHIQNILQSLDALSIPDAKAFLQTIIEKVILISEGELEIEFHRI